MLPRARLSRVTVLITSAHLRPLSARPLPPLCLPLLFVSMAKKPNHTDPFPVGEPAARPRLAPRDRGQWLWGSLPGPHPVCGEASLDPCLQERQRRGTLWTCRCRAHGSSAATHGAVKISSTRLNTLKRKHTSLSVFAQNGSGRTQPLGLGYRHGDQSPHSISRLLSQLQ